MPAYSRLTRQDRYTIESMIRKGHSQKSIAEAIGVDPSNVSRELRRAGMSRQSYCYVAADNHARSREWHGRTIAREILDQVDARLRAGQWSPQQISEALLRDGTGQVSHETIYQHIYRDKKAGGKLHTHLRHRCKSYRKRGLGRERRGRIKDQVMIDERPAVVEQRSRIGDWEMDTVIGKPGGKVLVTMVERKSRYTLIALADSKEAEEVTRKILAAMLPHRHQVETLTYDNGKEFANHRFIDQILDSQGYFAHPYHSWERGLNENTNGLIRQYFPKGSSFDERSHLEVARVQNLLNSRPRKCLDYQTPAAIFNPTPPLALAA